MADGFGRSSYRSSCSTAGRRRVQMIYPLAKVFHILFPRNRPLSTQQDTYRRCHGLTAKEAGESPECAPVAVWSIVDDSQCHYRL
jgi:hypothetical protein